MIVALIDNGSLEAAAHRNLRAVAQAVSAQTNVHVRAVSWKHSDRIASDNLDDTPAWTLTPFIRSLVALGQREFVFVPFFISAQGAIGSALRRDLETLRQEADDFEYTFTDGLAAGGVVPAIVVDRIRSAIAQHRLSSPPVVIVDHGGPSPASATLRDQLTQEIRTMLRREVGPVAAASMEGIHGPLLAEQLGQPEFNQGDVIVAPLFLSPGRHAGPGGDLAQICAAASSRCHLTELVGTHPLAVSALAGALRTTLSTLHAPTFA
jgi:sirohydrochlorin ferrochelatase